MTLALLEIVIFFSLGSLVLALPLQGLVALIERIPACPSLSSRWYAMLTIMPAGLAIGFVVAILGPWDSQLCRTLHQACLDQIKAWQIPPLVGGILGIGIVMVAGRLLRPYVSRRQRQDASVAISPELATKWRRVQHAVDAACGTPIPALQVIEGATPICHVRGMLAPRVVLSEGFLRQMDHDELVGAICHELAHVRRGDLTLGVLAYLCHCLLFFVPASRRSYERYLEDRECAADEWAVLRTRAPMALAAVIAKTGRQSTVTSIPAAVTLTAGGPLLTRRIQRLMTWPAACPPVRPWIEAVHLLAIGTLGASGIVWMMGYHHQFEAWGLHILQVLGVIA